MSRTLRERKSTSPGLNIWPTITAARPFHYVVPLQQCVYGGREDFEPAREMVNRTNVYARDVSAALPVNLSGFAFLDGIRSLGKCISSTSAATANSLRLKFAVARTHCTAAI
jgi:hypothetical protein